MKKDARLIDIESEEMKKIFSDYGSIAESPSLILGLRKALFDEIATGNSPPTLWVHNSYGQNGMLTIGNREKPTLVNFEGCKKYNVPVYVRASGGWHIYNDSNFVFVNVFVPPEDAKTLKIVKNEEDSSKVVIRAFEFNSMLTLKALNAAGVNNAYLHPKDTSSIMVDHNLIATNSAHFGRAIYLEGGIRCLETDIEISTKVLRLTEDERRDMLVRNTSVSRYNPSISPQQMKSLTTDAYTKGIGRDIYEWKSFPLTDMEMKKAVKYAEGYKSLTFMTPEELANIGEHDGKLCIVHWLKKYGPYTPGSY